MHDEMHPLFVNMAALAEVIAETFGKSCETVIFNMENENSSIIYIVNGHVTGRKLGDKMSQHELSCVNNIDDSNRALNYKSITKDGRILKSSLYLIKEDSGEKIGCFCINFDMSDLVVANKALENFFSVGKYENNSSKDNINDILIDIVDDTLHQMGTPISYLNKEDKVDIVKKLNNKGLFLIKGSVDYVAERLCVSRYTIYNYLEEIKLENE